MMADGPINICYPMAGDSLGGSHHSLLGLLDGLDRRQFHPIIILESPNGRLAEHFSAFEQIADPAPPRESFAVGRDFSVAKFASTFAGLKKRARLLRRMGAVIMHSNDGRTHASWALAAKLARCKLLWHHRGDPHARGLRYLAPWAADQIVTVSRFAMPSSNATRAARDAQVVFSPFETDLDVDRHHMRQQLIAELGAADNTVICGFFGSFIDRKRPLQFIEAVAALQARIERPVKGVMFGETTYVELETAMRERISHADVADIVHLMGYRSPGSDWIAACDLLLVPAVHEPLGRTLVEAMLVETPVVATRSGGNPEAILEGMGKLVPPDDPQAMAAACIEVLSNPGAASAMTARASADARIRFSRERHVNAIEQLYRQLADRA